MTLPTRTDWQNLKRRTECPDEPVKGVKLGEWLDKLNKREASMQALGMKDRVPALADLYGEAEVFLVNFLKKLDAKTVKKHAEFQKAFLNDFIGAARASKDDIKRYAPSLESLKGDLTKFFAMVTKLEPDKTDGRTLMAFHRGPLRGLVAALARARNVDGADRIEALLSPYDDLIEQKVTAETPVDKVGEVIKALLAASAKIKPLAERAGLM